MIWPKRIMLAVPFAISAALTAMLAFANHYPVRREHLAGYAFLFGTPWAWLLDTPLQCSGPQLHHRKRRWSGL
jgi:hypothetical protein